MKATIEQWRVFRTLVEEGSYARTAEVLDKSVSSVHVAVKRLQSSLGVPLFEVVGRRVHPTDVGRQLLPRANALLEQAQSLESLASTMADGEEPSIRIAFASIVSRRALIDVLRAVGNAFPHVRLSLHETVISGAADMLEKGDVEIAITPIVPTIGTYSSIGSIRFRPVAHPDHPLHALGRPLTLDDLRIARHIYVRDNATRPSGHKMSIEASDFWSVSTLDLLIELISAGLGFAWLPVSRIERELENGSLLPLPMAKLNDRHAELFLAHRDEVVAGPVSASLVEHLSQRLADSTNA